MNKDTNKPETTIFLNSKEEIHFVNELKQVVRSARNMAFASINYAQVQANGLIGKHIVEQEQKGKRRSDYGRQIIKLVSEELTKEFGKGFSVTNIKNFRKFYSEFPNLAIGQTPSAQSSMGNGQTPSAFLSWSHYERLMRVSSKEARDWYLEEAGNRMWSFRTLDRNISTQYYERLLLSQVKKDVKDEMLKNTDKYQRDKLEFIKNPAVLEFLGLPSNSGYKEQQLEQAILDNLQKFLMEMGKGFAFVGRQQLIRTDTEDYYIDLIFYNYLLKCFVLIDLKVGKITHQDVGQMDMYVRMFDEMKRGKGDNPTIGIVLCSETSRDIARYSVLKGNEQLFATQYQLILPTPQELQEEIERQTAIIRLQLKGKISDEDCEDSRIDCADSSELP